jgi:hypothetical protein
MQFGKQEEKKSQLKEKKEPRSTQTSGQHRQMRRQGATRRQIKNKRVTQGREEPGTKKTNESDIHAVEGNQKVKGPWTSTILSTRGREQDRRLRTERATTREQ